ncbi:MAG: hypothetical protein KDI61_11825 [Alphaproteobacteria bacterium]|nr:hypothetical protein [Alphaproteobacteria bacterium]MCB1840929.1 hypothetical protein [Alphaproteobacteria bacterium]
MDKFEERIRPIQAISREESLRFELSSIQVQYVENDLQLILNCWYQSTKKSRKLCVDFGTVAMFKSVFDFWHYAEFDDECDLVLDKKEKGIYPFYEIYPSYWIKRMRTKMPDHVDLNHYCFLSLDHIVDVLAYKHSPPKFEWLND